MHRLFSFLSRTWPWERLPKKTTAADMRTNFNVGVGQHIHCMECKLLWTCNLITLLRLLKYHITLSFSYFNFIKKCIDYHILVNVITKIILRQFSIKINDLWNSNDKSIIMYVKYNQLWGMQNHGQHIRV